MGLRGLLRGPHGPNSDPVKESFSLERQLVMHKVGYEHLLQRDVVSEVVRLMAFVTVLSKP